MASHDIASQIIARDVAASRLSSYAPGDRAEDAQAEKEKKLAALRALAQERIDEIKRNPYLSLIQKEALIEELNGAIEVATLTGNTASLSHALVRVAIKERIQEADRIEETARDAMVASIYALNAAETERVQAMSKWIDCNSEAAIRQFVNHFIEDVPALFRERQAELFTKAIQQDPSIVENFNKAPKYAREEVMAAYVVAQRDFELLREDPRYQNIRKAFEKADRLGLEAAPQVQELLRQARSEKGMKPAALEEQLNALSAAQIEKLSANLTQARQRLSVEEKALLETIGEGDAKGSNKAIAQLARKTLAEMREKPDIVLTEQQKAAVNAYLLTKEIVVMKRLGDEALTKGLRLERVTGTEQEMQARVNDAYGVIHDSMPPELRNIPEDKLKERIRETLEEADARNIKISRLDDYTHCPEVATFAKKVNEDMFAALRTKNMDALRAAEKAMAAGVNGGEDVTAGTPQSPTQVAWATPQPGPHNGRA